MTVSHPSKEEIISFLHSLRNDIIQAFEKFERSSRFKKEEWAYREQGGGEIAVLRGECFEKAAVNWSGVGGSKLPLQDKTEPFFATGISLITHMANPHVPTAHFNIRFIETADRFWFGGGYDLTPMGFPYEEDTLHFHNTAKNALSPYGSETYPTFSKAAAEYFYIPHRGKERGVGGIFFDYYNTGNFEKDFALWKAVGLSFLPALLPIYERRKDLSFTDEDREKQLHLRAHYVEFNLLYDRGTRFGFQSGGNPDAILCSMPPVVKW